MGVWMNEVYSLLVTRNPMLCVLAEYENSIEERDIAFYTLHDTVSLVSV